MKQCELYKKMQEYEKNSTDVNNGYAIYGYLKMCDKYDCSKCVVGWNGTRGSRFEELTERLEGILYEIRN